MFIQDLTHLITTPGGIPPSTHTLSYIVIARFTEICGAGIWTFLDEFFVTKLLMDISPPKMGKNTYARARREYVCRSEASVVGET